jgi:dihydropteroate synthase
VLAGPPPGLPPDLHPLIPLLIAVEGLDPDFARALELAVIAPEFDAKAQTSESPSDEHPRHRPSGSPSVFLSALPADFDHLFVCPEPVPGLWAALSHARDAYDAALADMSPTRIMGILNVTPDSFSDGGQYLDPGASEARAREMVEEGAQILDIGGESTRPGAQEVPDGEELRRVLPVVQRLAGQVAAEISVDTTKAAVARTCLEAGATIINDVSGLTLEPELAQEVASAGATLILMHMQGIPRTMQHSPQYEDVVADTMRFLRRQIRVALDAGVEEDRLWIDPGFGFGKTAAHNLEILRRLREYTSIGRPILIGTSRKSTIGRVLGGLPADQRLEGTAATVAVAITHGARIIRVHDVREMARVARMTDAILRSDSLSNS